MRRAGNPEKGSTRARQREYSTAGNLGWGALSQSPPEETFA